MLPVSAPFHCPLMEQAAEEMGKALAVVDLRAPAMPVISNVTACPVTDVEEIRHLLVQQITGVVRWRESILRLSEIGVIQLVECGAGKVLSGLGRRIDPSLGVTNIESPDDMDYFINNHI